MVLTCAHNCYDRKLGKELDVKVFIPANNGDQGIPVNIKKVYYPKEYREVKNDEDSFQFDYAVLELEKRVE